MTGLLRNKRIFHFQFSKVFVWIGVIHLPSHNPWTIHVYVLAFFCHFILSPLNSTYIHPIQSQTTSTYQYICLFFPPKKGIHKKKSWTFQRQGMMFPTLKACQGSPLKGRFLHLITEGQIFETSIFLEVWPQWWMKTTTRRWVGTAGVGLKTENQ